MNNSNGNDSPESMDLLDTAAANGNFNTFGRAIELAGLDQTLREPGPFTLFAPTDTAFQKLPPGKLDSLFDPANKSELTLLLNYHILKGRRSSQDVSNWKAAGTVHGQAAPIARSDGNMSIDGANVTTADIASSNGLIHAIDKVNVPRPIKR